MIAAAVGAAVVALSAGCQNSAATSSAAPDAASGAAQSASPAAVKWSGTLFAFQAGSDNHVDVYALAGSERKLVASTPAGKDSCARNSVTVSPDGKKVAWVNTGLERLDGDLFLGTLGGAPAKKVAGHILCGGTGPTWTPDSRSLLVTQRDGDRLTTGRIAADSGAFAPGADPGRVWSADGAFVARKDKSTVTIAKADGTVVRTVNYKPDWAECEGWLPQTLSADGRYLTAGYAACDPSRMLSVERLVDTTTGKEIALPVQKPERLYFRADGSMIVVSGSTGYVVQGDTIVAEQRLAADGLTILGYTA